MNFIWKAASAITVLVGLGGIFSGLFIPGLLALGAGIYGLAATSD